MALPSQRRIHVRKFQPCCYSVKGTWDINFEIKLPVGCYCFVVIHCSIEGIYDANLIRCSLDGHINLLSRLHADKIQGLLTEFSTCLYSVQNTLSCMSVCEYRRMNHFWLFKHLRLILGKDKLNRPALWVLVIFKFKDWSVLISI